MKSYDVIIVGAGPAGLHCAETLVGSGLSVLLLEKNSVVGKKVCAGGITQKDISFLNIPEELFEHKISATKLCSAYNHSSTNAREPFVYTINRSELAEWQLKKLDHTNVEVLKNARVTAVGDETVTVNGSDVYGYRFLVGADGYSSIVRRHLGIPVKERLIGIQYQVPINGYPPRFELHLHNHFFHSWYGWVFPHRDTLAVGCVADPRYISSRKLSRNLHRWLKKMDFDITDAEYQSQPVGCDYQGWQFGNIYLAGEAGGFASWLTGEGIYQSLVSGRAAAQHILDKDHQSEELREVLRYNDIQRKILRVLIMAGPFRILLHELLILLMQSSYIKKKINGSLTSPNGEPVS